jgi:soluble lytic murein transglycosylase-like protein
LKEKIMRRRIAAILLTAGIFWALIEETAAPFIKILLESRTADFIRSMFQEEEAQETVSPQTETQGSIDQWIEEAAEVYSLDPNLIRAVIDVESGGDSNAVSHKGAQGLMQLMPETCQLLGVDDPFNPRQNIIGGSRYLRDMLDKFGNIELALAAYNAGPAAVKRYRGIPPYRETQDYVRMVKQRMVNLKQRGK